MKFGKKLRRAETSFNRILGLELSFISYKELKKLLKQTLEHFKIWQELQSIVGTGFQVTECENLYLESAEKFMGTLCRDIIEIAWVYDSQIKQCTDEQKFYLKAYAFLNTEGVRKICKKFDKHVSGENILGSMMKKLQSQTFYLDIQSLGPYEKGALRQLLVGEGFEDETLEWLGTGGSWAVPALYKDVEATNMSKNEDAASIASDSTNDSREPPLPPIETPPLPNFQEPTSQASFYGYEHAAVTSPERFPSTAAETHFQDDCQQKKEGQQRREKRSTRTRRNVQCVTPTEDRQVGNLIVNYLPNEWSEIELLALFSPYGEILSTRVIRERFTRKSKGFGFVRFTTDEAAKRAIVDLNGTVTRGKRLKVAFAKPRRSRAKANLFASRFPSDWTSIALMKLFAPYGNIVECRVLRTVTGESKRCGFVRFENENDAMRAIVELNSSILPGEKARLRVKVADRERYQQMKKQKELFS